MPRYFFLGFIKMHILPYAAGGRLSAASNSARHREAQTHMPFTAQIISSFQLKKGQKDAEKNCEW